MKSTQLTRQAKIDLQNIKKYIAKNNPKIATQFVMLLKQKCEMLAQSPEIGIYHEEYCGLYKFPVGKYLIFYRLSKTGIEIIRILHGARDIQGIFKK